jgi:hypothetical protein
MSTETELQIGATDRARSLEAELSARVDHYRHLARFNYRFAYGLILLAVFLSIAAAVAGIVFDKSGKVVGIIALAPGFIALAAGTLKPQARANWHYRQCYALEELRRKLEYEGANVKEISKAWSELGERMSAEWENQLGLDVDAFAGSQKAMRQERTRQETRGAGAATGGANLEH